MHMRKINISLLRILACFLVFMIHACKMLGLEDGQWVFFDLGAVAPILFFEISGFVTANSISNIDDAGIFYKKRLFRILPMYYFILASWIIYYEFFSETEINIIDWIKYFIFLNRLNIPNYIQYDAAGGNIGGLWFMPSLILFYLIAPFLMKKINARKAFCFWIMAFVLARFVHDEAIGNLQYFFLGTLAFTAERENKKWPGIINSLIILYYMPFWGNYNIYPYLFGVMIIISSGMTIDSKRVVEIINIMDKYTYGVFLVHPFVMELVSYYKEYLCKITIHWRYPIAAIMIVATLIIAVVLTKITKCFDKFARI